MTVTVDGQTIQPSTTGITLDGAEVEKVIVDGQEAYSSVQQISLTISSNTYNYDIAAAAQNAGWDPARKVIVSLHIQSGVYVRGTGSTPWAMRTGDFGGRLDAPIDMTNDGRIIGRGGNGGNGGTSANDNGNNGGNGGSGFIVDADDTVDLTNNDTIAGGGGGGGGGGAGSDAIDKSCVYYDGGGGGGGAADAPGGSGSPNGGSASATGGGGGGNATPGAGDGGNGGNWGNNGAGGANGDQNGTACGGVSAGGSGGTRGYYIVGSSKVNYISSGNLFGRVT